jgi:hypothetical protein
MRLGHLTESEISGYLDRDLAADEYDRVERHLDECADCRFEVSAVADLLETDAAQPPADPAAPPTAEAGRVHRGSSRRGWRLPVGAGVLAAAALAVLVLVRSDGDPVGADGTGIQRFERDQPAALQAHQPAEGSILAREELRFAWSPSEGATYHFVLTAEDGALIWSETVQDTSVALPPTVTLADEQTYYWYVDAREAGSVRRTPVRSFVVRP